MAEFTYNNSKNTSIGHILFKLSCEYYPQVFFKNEYNAHSKALSANRFAIELRKLMNICCQNFLYAQNL